MTELSARVDELFRRQAEEWPLLAAGLAGLGTARTRRVVANGRALLVRHIPHRAASTTAAVDRESIAKRACFLCAANRPPEQRGLERADGFSLLCNPFPVVGRHLTIVHREHRPQRIDGRVGAMLDLAAALEGSFVLYNGPRCGASAPDHLHFQAGALEELPIVPLAAAEGGPVFDPWGARAFLFRSSDRARLVDEVNRLLDILASATAQEPEPWCNVVAFLEPQRGFTLLLFPRGKHRPEAFRTGELTVSPAAIDLSGILVTPVAQHFERLGGGDVAAVFREVTLPEQPFRSVAARLEAL